MEAGRSWLARLWSRDRRRAKRKTSLPLSAYYWDGEAPVARQVRDISPEGMYLVTQQRWYPNTLVRISLTRTDKSATDPKRSIRVTGRVVRSDRDGVGFAFILAPPGRPRDAPLPPDYVDKKMMSEFLQDLHKGENGAVDVLANVEAVITV